MSIDGTSAIGERSTRTATRARSDDAHPKVWSQLNFCEKSRYTEGRALTRLLADREHFPHVEDTVGAFRVLHDDLLRRRAA